MGLFDRFKNQDKGQEFFVIAGLGNPGREYAETKHNVGFCVIDRLAEKYHIDVTKFKQKALIGDGTINGKRVLLVKPQTFMNLSGESIREIIDYYKVDPQSELVVVCDDISLELGQLRIRKKGSAGGHNGLKNIIAQLGTDGFARIKMGVGNKPEGYDLADYVLGHFTGAERKIMDESIGYAVDAAVTMLEKGPDEAMNRFNGKRAGGEGK